MLIAVNNDPIFRRLARAMDRPQWIDDPRYATQIERGRRVDEVDEMVAAWTRERDAEEVVRLMRDAEVPVAKAYTIADIFADPHYRARGMLARVGHPRLGSVTLPGVLPRLSESPGEIREPGHLLGEDTDAVLRDVLGVAPERLARLRAAGVVK